MFYLHVSNRTENLLQQLAEVIRLDKQPDCFCRELFLIQSQGMERMVAQTLAFEFRSFCNYAFFLPLDFLYFIAEKFGIENPSSAFTRETVAWRLDGLLREIPGELYAPLRNYLKGSQLEIKRYQLATRLAYIFDQYQIMRPEMLDSWGRGALVGRNPAEPWQKDLWSRLIRQPHGTQHRGVLFGQLIATMKELRNTQVQLPKRISVIGLHTMPPIYLDFLNVLSKYMDIHFLLLSPCRDYWDISESARAGFTADRRLVPDLNKSQEKPYHPLLASLGRQGRDLQDLLLQHTDVSAEFASYTAPVTMSSMPDQLTLLERLQSDLLNGSLPGTLLPLPDHDDSVQIVSCHSKQRELMVLKDNLLRLLYKDDTLELRDIVVMAPDIQEYSGLIPAFFHDVQHSIADRSLRRRNATIQAFVAFLRLIGGRYGWSEVMDLLRQPAVYPQFELSHNDLEKLQDWIIGSGIRWGLSGSQRNHAGAADINETSWQAGIERMLMGYAVDTDDFVEGILPYPELEGQGADALGGLCSFIQIINQAEQQFRNDCSLAGWSDRFRKFMRKLFGDGAENEVCELLALAASLSESSALFHTHQVCFAVVRDWFENSTAERRSSSGFLRGHLTFCSMLPMRSIPFKVVCLIGLNDGIFPQNHMHDTFDLMQDDFRPGDRSPRADDRYQFLEAILAARTHLYLSYIGQSIKSNKKIPPSVVVAEFLDVLGKYYCRGDAVVHHSLHPFSVSYFNSSHPGKFSYNGYHFETAKALGCPPADKQRWFQWSIEPVEKVVEFKNLLAFYTNPQKFFMRNCLEVRLGDEGNVPQEREIFELQGLEKYSAEQEFIHRAGSGEVDELRRKLQCRGEWPLGEPGLVLSGRWQREMARYFETVQSIQCGNPCRDLELDAQIGQYRLVGTVRHCYQGGIMIQRYGVLRGRDLLSGWLHYLAARQTGALYSTWVVCTDGVVCFSSCHARPGLETLLDIYFQGCQAPSPFFVEPAFAHLQKSLKTADPEQPLKAAREKYLHSMEKGYEPEWETLLEGAAVTELFDERFEELSRTVMHQIWSNRDV